MANPIDSSSDIAIGEIYQSCSYHPCVCVYVDDDQLFGISLIDGHYGCGCSIRSCGPLKLTVQEALEIKFLGEKSSLLQKWGVEDVSWETHPDFMNFFEN
jgi:hypothetical protein